MRALLVVVGDPFIEICLKRFQSWVYLLSEGNSVELILHGSVLPFTDTIALGMTHFGLGVIDFLKLQIELVFVVFRSAIELSSPIGQHS